MSVVIVGGNECMERQYKDLCAMYDCKAKVYTKKLKSIGAPDLLRSVLEETRGQNLRIARSHQSSMAALRGILDAHAGGGVSV